MVSEFNEPVGCGQNFASQTLCFGWLQSLRPNISCHPFYENFRFVIFLRRGEKACTTLKTIYTPTFNQILKETHDQIYFFLP